MEHIICVFGDSGVHGAYAEKSWAEKLRIYLESSSDEGRILYSLGVVGNTSGDVLARFESEATSRKPTIIIFGVGKNDSVYFVDSNKPLVDENTFRSNIKKLSGLAKKFTKGVTFVG